MLFLVFYLLIGNVIILILDFRYFDIEKMDYREFFIYINI